jgi:beta-glucanase (GH16 family)
MVGVALMVGVAAGGDGQNVQMAPSATDPRWSLVFADGFDGQQLSSRWTSYEGAARTSPGWFEPSHVTVSAGLMTISAYRDAAYSDKRWASGGIAVRDHRPQTYGKYLVRLRADVGHGVALTALLWPDDESWPPEVNFVEDNGAERGTIYATVHYGADDRQITHSRAVDLTKWHVYGVEWTPGSIVYTLDGEPWASVQGEHVPRRPMHLAIQTQVWEKGTTFETPVDPTTPLRTNLQVDWVEQYTRRSG